MKRVTCSVQLMMLALLGLFILGSTQACAEKTHNTGLRCESYAEICECDDDMDECDEDMDEYDEEYEEEMERLERALGKARSMNQIYEVVFEDLEKKELKKLLADIEKNFPGLLKSLEKHFLKVEPMMIAEALDEVSGILEEFEDFGDSEEEMADYKLWLKIEQAEIKSLMLSWEIVAAKKRKAKAADISKLEKSLQVLLKELFELKLKEQTQEIAEVEKEVAEMKQHLQKRKKNAERIIKRRFQELTEDQTDELEW